VIFEHFGRHPDISIVYASSDAATQAAAKGLVVLTATEGIPLGRPVVVDIGRSSVEFDADISAALADAGVAADGADLLDALNDLPWLSMGTVGIRMIQRLRAGVTLAETIGEAGREATVASAGALAAHATSSVSSAEPATALVGTFASMLTYGTLEVRRGWTSMGARLQRVAAMATDVAEYAIPTRHGPPRTAWRRRTAGATRRIAVHTRAGVRGLG
jgi:hypothetical protein